MPSSPKPSSVPSINPAYPEKLLNFQEAIVEIMKGKKVTRTDWKGNDDCAFLKDGFLVLHLPGEPNEVTHSWMIRDVDILGTNYKIIN